jgi:DNA-binding XRE family transcriptional regulator
MLAIAETPRIRLEISGDKIPEHLLLYLRSAFKGIRISLAGKSTGDESDVFGTDWFRALKSESTPAENLREMREWLGISAAELSRRTGISPQHISGMENGTRTIGKKIATKLANALGCASASFVG